MIYTTIHSPIGPLLLSGDGESLQGLYMQGGPRPLAIDPRWQREDHAFAEARGQLSEYFDGSRRSFDLDLNLAGNPFEQSVWQALQEIPFGTTTSYGALAERIGHPTAARAVGLANGRNPIAVIVPVPPGDRCRRLADRIRRRPRAQAFPARPGGRSASAAR